MRKFKKKALAKATAQGLALSATNRINAQGELLLYGVIGDWFDGLDAETIVHELESLSNGTGPLPVRIHSEGGNIVEGLAIYNRLKYNERPVEVTIDGIALSMASVIAMAGDTVRIPPNAFIMIHKPNGPSYGESDDHRRTADVYDQFEDTVADIYAAKTGIDKETIKAMMAAETWLNGEQAVEMGFADELVAPIQAVAQADLSQFDKAPQAAVNLFHRPPPAGNPTAATAANKPKPKGDDMNLDQRAKAVGLCRLDGETDAQLKARVVAAEAKAKSGEEGAGDAGGEAAGAENRGGSRREAAAGGEEEEDEIPAAAASKAENAGSTAAAAIAAERTRCKDIRNLGKTHRLDDSLVETLIDSGASVAEARNQALDALAKRQMNNLPGGHVTVAHNGEALRAGMVAALMNRFDPGAHKLADDAVNYRGMSLLDMAKEVLNYGGKSTRGMSPMAVAAEAMHSTSDFPAILADVANKTLRQGYDAAPRTFQPFCRQTTASDFKYINRAQLGEAPELEKVDENGEFRYGTMGEDNQRYRLETYGKIIALTRQTIINDDLDAFSRIPQAFGASAAELESNIVWGLLTGNVKMADNKALFHADHNNIAGAGAISVETLTETRKLMRRQKGINSKRPLNLAGEYLIVPAALETEGQRILSEVLSAKSADVNPFANTLQLIVEPRLDDVSETAWYVAAAPSRIDTIEYAYLTGEEGVYIETQQGFEVDGIKIKARQDFGAGAIDHRGFVRNAGA